jgi:NADH-quinone oxidoreductase subunit H
MDPIYKTLLVLGIAFFTILTAAAYTVMIERLLSAWIQQRVGPNRVGSVVTPFWDKMPDFLRKNRLLSFGLLQPLADVLKLLLKEDIIPAKANKFVHFLAPMIAVTVAFITMGVMPFARGIQVADVNIGILYTLAATSIGVYGVTLSGWSSNSKYALLGGLRSSAQMISYELAMGMAVVSVILLTNARNTDIGAGSLSLVSIVEAQRGCWNVFPNFLGFLIFTTCAFAEANRSPFDLVEAEQELVGGFHTEYSSMKFALFFLAEYLHVIAGSMAITTLFFGGYLGPGENVVMEWGLKTFGDWFSTFETVWGLFWFVTKTLFFMIVFVWVRWTLPRFKYNQLMDIGWKAFLPLALVNLVMIAGGIFVWYNYFK